MKGRGSPADMLRTLWKHRGLLGQLLAREIGTRYRGSVMGFAWSFVNPLLLLAVYTFVFTEVFKARWGDSPDTGGRADFAMILFVGMIVHNTFAEPFTRAPGLVLANANYVKKVVFPLELLPCVSIGATLFHSVLSVVALLVVQLILSGRVPWTAPLVLVTLVPLVIATMGVVWFFASVGVFLRDVGQATPLLSTVLLFLAPVFYPVSALPEAYRYWLQLNPLTFVIEQCREVLLWNRLPDWIGLGKYAAVSLFVGWAGYWWFQRTKKGFADVL